MVTRRLRLRTDHAVNSQIEAVTRHLSRKQIISIVEAQEPINVWEGSIRSGKTVASLLRWLMFVAKPPRTGELFIVGKTRETVARNLFGPLQDPSLFGPLCKLIKYNSGAPTASILGRTVHVLGANDAKSEPKVRGATVAGAYADEITTLPEPFFNRLVDRCSVPGAKLFGTTNPDNPAHWLRKEWLLRPRETGTRSWHFTMDDNPHLDAAYVARMKRTYTGLWYRRFILGHWVQAEGAIYDMWDEERHVVDILPRIVRWIGQGIDYGTTNPFAALMLGLGEDGRLYFTNEWRYSSKSARRSLTDMEYSRRLRDWNASIVRPHEGGQPGVRPEWTVVDPSAASFITQLFRDGLTPVGGDNSVIDGIRLLASLLASGALKVHRSCSGWREEAPGYVWDAKWAAEHGEDRPIKADDHSLDGGRYVVKTTENMWRPHLAAAA